MEAAPTCELMEAPRMLGFSGIRRTTPLVAQIGPASGAPGEASDASDAAGRRSSAATA